MPGARAAMLRRAQHVASHYSPATGAQLETLIRELTLRQAQRLLDLVRAVDDDVASAVMEAELRLWERILALRADLAGELTVLREEAQRDVPRRGNS